MTAADPKGRLVIPPTRKPRADSGRFGSYCHSRPKKADNSVSARLCSGRAPMQSDSVQRRLAAILAADVAGYSRLMGVDEIGTLTALKAHRRELVDPAIAGHSGRIV